MKIDYKREIRKALKGKEPYKMIKYAGINLIFKEKQGV